MTRNIGLDSLGLRFRVFNRKNRKNPNSTELNRISLEIGEISPGPERYPPPPGGGGCGGGGQQAVRVGGGGVTGISKLLERSE